jgi:hypothetical protein
VEWLKVSSSPSTAKNKNHKGKKSQRYTHWKLGWPNAFLSKKKENYILPFSFPASINYNWTDFGALFFEPGIQVLERPNSTDRTRY